MKQREQFAVPRRATEQIRTRNPELRALLVAVLGVGGVVGGEVPAEAQGMPDFAAHFRHVANESTLVAPPRVAQRPVDSRAAARFEVLMQKTELLGTEFGELEDMVLANNIPLDRQLSFVEAVFAHEGAYREYLSDEGLSAQKLSRMLTLISRVSASVNRAYVSGETIRGREAMFDISALRASARRLTGIGPRGLGSCNSALVGVGSDIVYTTAEHCADARIKAAYTFSGPSDGTDIQVGPVDRRDYGPWKIVDTKKLVAYDPALSDDQLMGKVVATFGYRADGTEYVLYSIYIPSGPHLRLRLMGPEFADKLARPLNQSAFILTPPEDSTLLGYDERGNPVVGASGTSGSLVAYPGTQWKFVGVRAAQTITDDECAKLCHPISHITQPEAFGDAYARMRAQFATR